MANDKKNHSAGSWVIPIVFLFTPLMPLGIIMLIVKFIAWAKTEMSYTADYDEAARYDKTSQAAPAAGHKQTGAEFNKTHAAEIIRERIRESDRVRERAKSSSGNNTRAETTSPADSVSQIKQTAKINAVINRRTETEMRMRKAQKGLTAINVLLVIAAIVLYVISGSFLLATVTSQSFRLGFLITCVTHFGLGNIAVIARVLTPRRLSRYKRYVAYIGGSEVVLLRDLALGTGISRGRVVKDLQRMIDKGFFGTTAYIDYNLQAFVLNSTAAANYSSENPQAVKKPKQEERQQRQTGERTVDEYERILRALRKLNDEIADEAVSENIERIEQISSKIFVTVRENPQKLPQIRRLMSYYLPTTMKLLDMYAKFEKQGLSSNSIRDMKDRINNVLDTLATGFGRQLERLYFDDVIDISADINVLENMMQRDGLSGSSAFGSAAAAMEKLEEEQDGLQF